MAGGKYAALVESGGVPESTNLKTSGKPSYDDRSSYQQTVTMDTNFAGNSNPFGKGSRRTDNNRIVTILLVLNYMIGSGILNTPQTFRDSGVAATTVLYAIACIAVWLGAVVLILAAETSSANGTGGSLEDLEFSVLASRTMGEHGEVLINASIVVHNFGAVCSYILLIGGLTTSMFVERLGDDVSDSVILPLWTSFYFVAPLMVLFFVLPPCLVRHFSNLRWLSAFSFVAISAVVGLVGLGSPSYADAARATADHNPGLDAPIVWWNWTGAVAKLGSAVFALSCAPAALHSYSAMSKRNESEWSTVVTYAVLLGGGLCYGTGLMGYLCFRGATEGDILDNFSGGPASFFKILVLAHLIMYIPNELVILRHSVFELAGQDVMMANFCSVATATVAILSTIVGLVMVLMLAGMAQGELFGYVLDLTGGITASLTSFVIPALAYLKATEHTKGPNTAPMYRVACQILAGVGFTIMIVVPGAVMGSALGKR